MMTGNNADAQGEYIDVDGGGAAAAVAADPADTEIPTNPNLSLQDYLWFSKLASKDNETPGGLQRILNESGQTIDCSDKYKGLAIYKQIARLANYDPQESPRSGQPEASNVLALAHLFVLLHLYNELLPSKNRLSFGKEEQNLASLRQLMADTLKLYPEVMSKEHQVAQSILTKDGRLIQELLQPENAAPAAIRVLLIDSMLDYFDQVQAQIDSLFEQERVALLGRFSQHEQVVATITTNQDFVAAVKAQFDGEEGWIGEVGSKNWNDVMRWLRDEFTPSEDAVALAGRLITSGIAQLYDTLLQHDPWCQYLQKDDLKQQLSSGQFPKSAGRQAEVAELSKGLLKIVQDAQAFEAYRLIAFTRLSTIMSGFDDAGLLASKFSASEIARISQAFEGLAMRQAHQQRHQQDTFDGLKTLKSQTGLTGAMNPMFRMLEQREQETLEMRMATLASESSGAVVEPSSPRVFETLKGTTLKRLEIRSQIHHNLVGAGKTGMAVMHEGAHSVDLPSKKQPRGLRYFIGLAAARLEKLKSPANAKSKARGKLEIQVDWDSAAGGGVGQERVKTPTESQAGNAHLSVMPAEDPYLVPSAVLAPSQMAESQQQHEGVDLLPKPAPRRRAAPGVSPVEDSAVPELPEFHRSQPKARPRNPQAPPKAVDGLEEEHEQTYVPVANRGQEDAEVPAQLYATVDKHKDGGAPATLPKTTVTVQNPNGEAVQMASLSSPVPSGSDLVDGGATAQSPREVEEVYGNADSDGEGPAAPQQQQPAQASPARQDIEDKLALLRRVREQNSHTLSPQAKGVAGGNSKPPVPQRPPKGHAGGPQTLMPSPKPSSGQARGKDADANKKPGAPGLAASNSADNN